MKTWKLMSGMVLAGLGLGAAQGMELEGLGGQLLVDGRARYEMASQTGLDRSDACTLRLRLGYGTERLNGFSALVEGEGTLALDDSGYDPYPGAQGTAGKVVVADPESLELNRAQVDWRNEAASVTLGRQRIIRNNARFIGNVGWRQNEQTYDAVTAGWQPAEGVSLFYGYLDKAVRIFGSGADNPVQRKFEMESHAAEAQWTASKEVKTGAYAYLLGIENSPADASDTYGAWIEMNKGLGGEDVSATLRLELANQSDNRFSPDTADFDLGYLHLSGELKKKGLGSVAIGYEVLEGDGARGFSTPLATLHAFNGFADVFLATPASGLQDSYLTVSAPVAKDVTASATWHEFRGDHASVRYGGELDLVVAWKINANLGATAKAALYDGGRGAPGAAAANVTRIWLQLDAKY